jgi:hypothetical protein
MPVQIFDNGSCLKGATPQGGGAHPSDTDYGSDKEQIKWPLKA